MYIIGLLQSWPEADALWLNDRLIPRRAASSNASDIDPVETGCNQCFYIYNTLLNR
jgi:hypothetical protein